MAEDIKKMPVGAGLPEMPEEIGLCARRRSRLTGNGYFLFSWVWPYFSFLFHAGIWPTRWTPRASTFPYRPKAAWP